MHPQPVRHEALRLVSSGLSLSEVSKRTGVSRSAIRDWRDRPDAGRWPSTCCRCAADVAQPDGPAYAHLLGLYLGDGCVSALRNNVYSLRIACCDAYPRLMAECEASVRAVRPGKVFRVSSDGCTYILALWKHWPCLFPQHGPGRKHDRAIVLEPWQREIVEQHPGPFLRGLFHSDGCRITNWTVRTVAGQPKRYEYPRYFFTNASADIRGLCCWALGLVGAEHRHPTERDISVARKASVAILDELVGPKG